MSWTERILNDIRITTGDGTVYSPEYIDAEYVQEFNLASFDFRNQSGTLVKRQEPRSRVFRMKIFFQGDNHLDVSEAFRVSSFDKRAWNISHPLYDDIIAHPRSIQVNNKKQNVSQITVLLLETILGQFPIAGVSPFDNINDLKTELDEVTALSYDAQTADISGAEIAIINTDINDLEAINDPSIEVPEDKVTFSNRINDARRAVTNITSAGATAMRQIQGAINYPFTVIDDVRASIENLEAQFDRLVISVGTLSGLSRNDRVYVESTGANLVSSSAAATISQLEDSPFVSRTEVDDVSNRVLAFYNSYIDTIDSLQTDSQTELDSYAPNPDVVGGVQQLVYFTISKLAEIALEGQQEIIVELEADSNPIVLANRFYGLSGDDSTIDRFINTNNIGLSELLLVKKGRQLVYYK